MIARLARLARRNGVATGATAAALAAAVVVSGTGDPARPEPEPAGATAWLPSTVPGVLSEVNGLAARVGATVEPAGSAGHRLRVDHADPDVYVTDVDARRISRISARTLTVAAERDYPAEVLLAVAGDRRYVVTPGDGSVAEVDPDTLEPRGEPVGLLPPIGAVLGRPDGGLWAYSIPLGAVVPIRDGRAGPAVATAFYGDDVALVGHGDGAILVDRTKRMVVEVDAGGAVTSWPALPPGTSGDLATPPATAGPVLPIVDVDAGVLLLLRRDQPVRQVPLDGGPGDRGPPAVYGSVVYVPGSGRVLRHDLDTGEPLPPLVVTGYPAGVEVSVVNELLWANEPGGPHALVSDGETVRPILKYTRRPAPSPTPSASPSASPTPSASPSPSASPRPSRTSSPRPSRSSPPTSRPEPAPSKPEPTRPRPKPTPTGPALTVPVTYRVASIRSLQHLEGPGSAARDRAKLSGATWRLTRGGGIGFRAPGIASTLLPATGGYRVNGSRVTWAASSEFDIPDTAHNTLEVTGTVRLGEPDVMTLTYTARSETWAEVNGQKFHSLVVNRFTATVTLAAS
ncbi:hypothetical protein Aph02nite_48700 [Actinoplanes philippinensis]|uniref:Uncharacterized protein n=1 Tax=Actinoplanes philippinensis TaxID=35752 RepID=A0A1I2HZL5_9ACTN|nr:hypothetical protein [Actinoplanes philippinensis]GIE78920.1 hypothetical protein Aph02nite_48700 [Actinoplanes philippinensis]SFF34207.1 hypothetical protein SAMN05421541_10918 [Actinoplanes philippinensis]